MTQPRCETCSKMFRFLLVVFGLIETAHVVWTGETLGGVKIMGTGIKTTVCGEHADKDHNHD